MNSTNGNATFQVGDRVAIEIGRSNLTGVIIEDRGPIGVQGRHLYQVQVPMDPFEPMIMELSGEEMTAAAPATTDIDKEKAIEYLANGGLIAILRSNRFGGKNQPRAWLSLGQRGNVTHTFDPDRGVVGGQTVPYLAVRGEKIFTPKRSEVMSFVKSFGLDDKEAKSVISEVGTTP